MRGSITIQDCDAEIMCMEQLSADYFKLELKAPYIAKRARPGQFVNIAVSTGLVPLLRRPLSIGWCDGARESIGLVFKLIGSGTHELSRRRTGDVIKCLGPLGQPLLLPENGSVLLVGGGVGMPPILFSASSLLAERVTVLQGARSADQLLFRDELAELGVRIVITTEDGSAGSHGLVTHELEVLLKSLAKPVHVVSCGPTPMLKAVAKLTRQRDVPTQVVLEQRMACGFGVCMGCPVWIKPTDGTRHHYSLVCKDGPAFDALEVFTS